MKKQMQVKWSEVEWLPFTKEQLDLIGDPYDEQEKLEKFIKAAKEGNVNKPEAKKIFYAQITN